MTGFVGRKEIEEAEVFGPIFVPIKTLKDIFSELEIQRCDLLKIDTEGYEVSVLKSLEDVLCPETIPYVVAEVGQRGFVRRVCLLKKWCLGC